MVGRTSKTREATQTVGLHGKHQAVDQNTNTTVRTGYRRPQSQCFSNSQSTCPVWGNATHNQLALSYTICSARRAPRPGAPGTCPIGPMVNPALDITELPIGVSLISIDLSKPQKTNKLIWHVFGLWFDMPLNATLLIRHGQDIQHSSYKR